MLVRTLLTLLVAGVLLGGCGRETPSTEASRAVKAIALSGSDIPRADRLLDELRELAKNNPEVGDIREHLAGGLNNAIAFSGSDFARADGLLDELRELAKNIPEEGRVRQHLAGGLNNAIAWSGSDIPRANRLLHELRELAEAHPEEGRVRKRLAMGLRNAIARSGSDFARADRLLDELRGLVKGESEGALTLPPRPTAAKPSQREGEEDMGIRENLISAYGESIDNATEAGDVGRAAVMAEALVPLWEAAENRPDFGECNRVHIEAAIDLAKEQGDAESERRLRAAREAIFGE